MIGRKAWFLSSEIENGEPDQSRFHIIPVPFEESVSYGTGTKDGPAAILEASSQLELWDGLSNPSLAGIHTWDPLERPKFETLENFLDRIGSVADIVLDIGAVPITIGGEHSISFGPVRACRDAYEEVGVIQFDAHADLRKEYEGSRFSHACVMRRIHDELKLPLFQVGIRGISEEEQDFIDSHNIPGITGWEAAREQLNDLSLPDDFPKKVYLSIDVDGLDPSIMPATGTPVPGGLGWYQILSMIESVAEKREIVGFDVVELAPIPGLHFCEFTAAQLIYQMMGMIPKQKG